MINMRLVSSYDEKDLVRTVCQIAFGDGARALDIEGLLHPVDEMICHAAVRPESGHSDLRLLSILRSLTLVYIANGTPRKMSINLRSRWLQRPTSPGRAP